MSMTDPISEMLTRIRNASQARHLSVDIPSSKVKVEIAKVLKEKGFIGSCEKIEDGKQGILRISLRYGEHGEEIIDGIKRISKPGLRKWVKAGAVPRIHGGDGIAIVSTSKGIMTDQQCRDENVGGEVLCSVW